MWSEWFGWYGVAAILSAYAGASFGVLGVSDRTYLWLNATGAIGVAVDAYRQKNWQPAVLNVVWAIVAVTAIVRSV